MPMKRQWTLTEADLRELPDKELVQKVISSVLEFVGELGPGEDDYELVRQTPKTAQFFWAMRLLESEVNNGGFEQYFWNSSCTLADVALKGYQAIGAEKYVDFLRKALALVGKQSWKDRRHRFHSDWKAYKRACPRELDALDDEFYAADCGDPGSGGGDDDLYEKKIDYIRKNAKAISRL
jgi:uncharacterized protein DUF4375